MALRAAHRSKLKKVLGESTYFFGLRKYRSRISQMVREIDEIAVTVYQAAAAKDAAWAKDTSAPCLERAKAMSLFSACERARAIIEKLRKLGGVKIRRNYMEACIGEIEMLSLYDPASHIQEPPDFECGDRIIRSRRFELSSRTAISAC